jgi:signal transduction histidine kinase
MASPGTLFGFDLSRITRPSPIPRTREETDQHYAEVTARLSTLNASAALGITILTILALWGQWRSVLCVGLTFAMLIPFNVWANRSLVLRYGARAELLRSAVNIAGTVWAGRAAHWVGPVWLWLPFVALAFSNLDRKVARGTAAAYCVALDAVALADSVPWIYPLSATAFAIFCVQISSMRQVVIRDMLARAARHAAEMARSHELLQQAHERVSLETIARQEAERELQQGQKLEAVGRLAAGVAHEINTPSSS